MTEAEDCAQCGHPFEPHLLIATMFTTVDDVGEVPIGGYVRCPVEGCRCHSTWSVRGWVDDALAHETSAGNEP